MPDRDAVTTLVDRMVARAHIPSRAEREDLRRELLTHFEEACEGPSGVTGAIERFGTEALVVRSWRQVYRWDHLFLYCAKVAASAVACVAAALAIEFVVNLRIGLPAEAWRLTPHFSRTAAMAVAVVLCLVAAREIGRRSLTVRRACGAIVAYAGLCVMLQIASEAALGLFVTATLLAGVGSASAKLRRWSSRLLVALAGFAATLYIRHLNLHIDFGAMRATLIGCQYLAVWLSTLLILSGFDHAFRSMLRPHPPA